MENKLRRLCAAVREPDAAAEEAARERQARLAKPPGSLGRLEALAAQLAGISGSACPRIDKKELLVFAADNGVTAEGVSSAPRSVTLRQTLNLVRGVTGGAVLARHFGSGVTVCDVGVDADIPASVGVLNRKIARGTGNICTGAAMTREQALAAVLCGAELARDCGADIIGVGEMGIGNTTTSACVLAVLLGADAEQVTGRGGGLSDAGLQRKMDAVRRALDLNRPDAGDVIDVLAKVGGLDIAAMCGAFIGAAAARKPAVIDGLISVTAALCAVRLCPGVRAYLIPGHASCEPGYAAAAEALELRPMLLLDMRLGEGSGCPPVFALADAACAVLRDMATFAEAGIDDGYLAELRAAERSHG